MINNQPLGDLWYLQDNDAESQYYGQTFRFDFSYIHSDEIKAVYKEYIWQKHRTGSKAIRTLVGEVVSFKYFIFFAQQQKIDSFTVLDNVIVDLFVSYLHTVISPIRKKTLAYETQKSCLDALKNVISWCLIHRPDTVPTVKIFTGNEFLGVNRHLNIDFIPDEVMTQINMALKVEENPYLKYGIIILQSTGMRIGDLLKLRTDCIQPHFISGYTITWFDHKKRMERTPIPVRAECAYAVQKLIEITEPLRKEVDDSMKDMLFIYRISTSRLGKKIGIPNQSTIGDWLHNFTKKHHIVDSNGEPYNLTAHQFRRTLGTDMLSKGTDMNVIQQVLGHSRSSTTKLYYADVKDKERGEIFRKVGIIGNIDMVDDSSFENASEKKWFLANKHKSAQLCDGYCTKPVEKGMVCDRLLRRQKCYSCSRYITTPEYLHVHRSHLSRLEKQLEEGAIYGEHYAEHFRPTIEILKVIIEKLEEFQNGRD